MIYGTAWQWSSWNNITISRRSAHCSGMLAQPDPSANVVTMRSPMRAFIAVRERRRSGRAAVGSGPWEPSLQAGGTVAEASPLCWPRRRYPATDRDGQRSRPSHCVSCRGHKSMEATAQPLIDLFFALCQDRHKMQYGPPTLPQGDKRLRNRPVVPGGSRRYRSS